MAGPAPTTLTNCRDRSAGPVHSSGWLFAAVYQCPQRPDHLRTVLRLEEMRGELDQAISQRRPRVDDVELSPMLLLVLFEPLQIDRCFFAILKYEIETANADAEVAAGPSDDRIAEAAGFADWPQRSFREAWHRRITDQHSLAGADDQRSNRKDRRGPGPVQCLVIHHFGRPNASESSRKSLIAR